MESGDSRNRPRPVANAEGATARPRSLARCPRTSLPAAPEPERRMMHRECWPASSRWPQYIRQPGSLLYGATASPGSYRQAAMFSAVPLWTRSSDPLCMESSYGRERLRRVRFPRAKSRGSAWISIRCRGDRDRRRARVWHPCCRSRHERRERTSASTPSARPASRGRLTQRGGRGRLPGSLQWNDRFGREAAIRFTWEAVAFNLALGFRAWRHLGAAWRA